MTCVHKEYEVKMLVQSLRLQMNFLLAYNLLFSREELTFVREWE